MKIILQIVSFEYYDLQTFWILSQFHYCRSDKLTIFFNLLSYFFLQNRGYFYSKLDTCLFEN